jgi:hypothetical protein
MKRSLHTVPVKSVPAETTHFHAVTMTASSSFIGPKRWTSEVAESELYGGCGRTVQPNFATRSMAFKLVRGLVLCCSRKVIFVLLWPGYVHSVSSVQSSSAVICRSALMSCSGRTSLCELTAVQGLYHTPLSPLLKCITHRLTAQIHCLVSAYVQWASMNVSGCNFFCMEEFIDPPLLCTHFNIRRQLAKLLLCCYLSHGNKTYKLLAGRFNFYCLSCRQHPPLTLWANIMK